MTTYYVYDKQNFYTENPVHVEDGAEAPPRCTVYEPRTSPGLRPWWSGAGWIPVHDLRKLDLDQKKEILLTLCTAIRPPAPEAKYSLAEIASWPYQLAEAQAVEQGGAPGPMIKAMSKASGDDPKALATTILAAHAQRVEQLAQANVMVQKLRNQIKDALSDDQLPSHNRILSLVYG